MKPVEGLAVWFILGYLSGKSGDRTLALLCYANALLAAWCLVLDWKIKRARARLAELARS